jgi:hypothetical protein
MELILIVGGLLLLDILAMRFGVDSRIVDRRDQRPWWPDLMNGVRPRPTLRVRLAHGLRVLAVRIEPSSAGG